MYRTKTIDRKSIGFLIDELITTHIKVTNTIGGDVAIQRYNDLLKLINEVLTEISDTEGYDEAIDMQFKTTVGQLWIVLQSCWDAQEVVMKLELNEQNALEIASAAKLAQQFNAQRNTLIKNIDTLLGEEHMTVLDKSYA